MNSLRYLVAAFALGASASGCAALSKAKPSDPPFDRKARSAEVVREFEQKRDDAQYQSARSRWTQGDADGCIEVLRKLVARAPHHRDAVLLFAEYHLVQQSPKAAVGPVENLLDKHAGDAEVHYTLGLLYQATDAHEQATEQFAVAAEADPRNPLYTAMVETCQHDGASEAQSQRR